MKRKISREQAEQLFDQARAVSSDLKKVRNGLRMHIYLSEETYITIEYNKNNREKAYFIEEQKTGL